MSDCNLQQLDNGKWWCPRCDPHKRRLLPVNAKRNCKPRAKRRSRGLGDTVAKLTAAVGITPCKGCKKRQRKLNQWFPYKADTKKPRVAFWSPGLRMGGAERWTVDLARHLDRDRVDVAGIGIGRRDCDPHLLDLARQAGPVLFDRGAIKQCFKGVDLVVFWGSKPPGYPRHSLFVSHGGGPWAAGLAARITDWGIQLAAVSQFAANAFPHPADVRVVHNGVSLERLEPAAGRDATRRRLGLAPGELAVGFIGRMTACKNPIAAQLAVEHLDRPARAVYVGPTEKPVAAALDAAAPKPIRTGRREDLGDVYAALDCFVLASPSEGFSLARIEAWQCGVPTVSTPVGAVPELEARHGRLTVRVPVDPTGPELAAAVAEAVSPENRATVEHAQAVAREHYTAQAMAARWADVLEEICQKTKKKKKHHRGTEGTEKEKGEREKRKKGETQEP